MKVWGENGKQIVHLYLGGDETLEQILPARPLRGKVLRQRDVGETE